MSNLIEDTPKKELDWLLKQIQQREIALPDFQRDFVWDPSATQELIVSIANNYPAGSLLAIRNTHDYFAAREFEDAPPLNGSKPTYLILDGQQRLTSLYQAFYGVGEYQYFLKLRPLIEGKEIDDEGVLFHVRSAAKRGWQAGVTAKYSTIKGQADDLVLPLKVLLGTKDGYLGWADTVAERLDDGDERRQLKSQLLSLRTQLISNIEDYTFPVVLLSDKTPADAVCTIFETLNRTGVKLSVFDLLAARFWPEGVKLRDMWEKALADYPIIQDFQIDPYYVLQSVALLTSDKAPSCKRKDVLELTPKHVQTRWESAIRGLSQTLSILQDDCGVLIPKWLPYATMTIPLAAILAKHPVDKGLSAGTTRQKLVRWFWCSVFGQSYETSPNSQAASDFTAMSTWISDGSTPAEIASFSFEQSALYEVSPRQRALYRGVIVLILSQKPRDFHAVTPLDRALMTKDNVDDHHVFPDAHLRDEGVKEAKRRDCILNRTLIDRATNQSLSRRSPADYFAEVKQRLGDVKFAELLSSHMLPTETDAPLMTNDYDAFLEWRCDRIGREIKKVTENA